MSLGVQSGGVYSTNVETGSYTGTGTGGASNPCSITFKNTPVYVCITGDTKKLELFCQDEIGAGYSLPQSSNGSMMTSVSVSGKTVSWYYTASYEPSSGQHQMNKSGATYHFFALTV